MHGRHILKRRQMWQRRSKMRRVHTRQNVTRLLRSTRPALSRGVRRGGGVIIVGRRRRRYCASVLGARFALACVRARLVRQSVFLLS